MEAYITPERTANAIMLDSSFTGHYLIVEGKKDLKLYGKFVKFDDFRILPAFGNDKVREVLKILDERGFDRRIGIIDSDFNQILGVKETINGLFITDDHDIEVMIIKTDALNHLLNVFCSKASIENFEKIQGKPIRDLLFSLGEEIGYLKYANKMYDLGLVFKPVEVDGNSLKYKNLVCNKTFAYLGRDKLIETAINYSVNRGTNIKSKDIISEKYNETSLLELDLNHLVNGHDLSQFLYILMKKILKSRNKMLQDYNSVEDSLILAYDYANFKETKIFESISSWAKMNKIEIFNN
jgi:hypothetical protein